MFSFLNLALSLCAILFPLQALADDGDDFSNNLFSDLAPILALFGEQVAKQFMSQSIGWADNIIFAMAPLGIITAIVGAIRVGGPAWLKAIIGRARENRAASEVELMSSTSPDVCELWNGQTIVRMMGSPPIVQIIYFLDAVPDSNERIFTLEEAINKKLIERKENYNFLRIFEHILTNKLQTEQNEGLAEDDEKTRLEQDSNESTSPPNILFNVRPAKGRLQLYFTAVIGVLLQFGVLVFSGCITYYPTLAFKKGDGPVISYAYPLTASGTLILVLGMLICSFVVEQSTNEEIWTINKQTWTALEETEKTKEETRETKEETRKTEEGTRKTKEETRKTKREHKFNLMWLQQGQEVNNQMFDSYAIFALESRDSILTSRSKSDPEPLSISRGTIKYRFAELLYRILRPLLQFFYKGNHSPALSLVNFKILVISGTLISICGFVVQFIGLRGMHWSATIAQLSATLIMVVLRAWVRWDLASRPYSQRVAQGHELDWLATRIATEPNCAGKGLWAKPDSNDPFWTSECWRWEVMTGGDVKGYEIRDIQKNSTENTGNLTADAENPTADAENPMVDVDSLMVEVDSLMADIDNLMADAENATADAENPMVDVDNLMADAENPVVDGEDLAADEVVKARQRLGMLSHWPSKASQPAISVAIAIEAVMNLLTDTYDNGVNSLTWSMDGLVDLESRNIFFKLQKNHNRWTADATEIEAALSLWLYSVGERERTEVTARRGSKDLIQNPQENGMRDWLRLGNAALRKENIRLLGVNKPASRRDLTWYLGEKANMISIVQENESNTDTTSDTIIVESQRVVGFRGDPASNSIHAKTIFRRVGTLCDVKIGEHKEEDTNHASANEYLAMVSDMPLEMLLAQEMFSAFMWGFAKKVGRIDGDSKVHRNDTKIAIDANDWQNIRLENSKLLRVAEAFQKAGLGSVEDAYTTIIPPLSLQEKLPFALTVVEYAQGIAQEAEVAGQWELAGDIYLWLFELGRTFAAPDLVAVKATAVLTEFSSLVNCMLKDSEAQRRSEETLRVLADLKTKLSKALETADHSIREVIEWLFVLQHRDREGKHMERSPHRHETATALKSLAGRHYSGYTPLHRTVIDDVGFEVRALLWGGADVNCKDILGWTALHYSTLSAHIAPEFFMDAPFKSANPNLRTLIGWTALHLAAYNNSCSMGWTLLDQRCDLEIQGRDGMRPLHIAVREGNEDMVQWLLDAGADIDARDSARRTPLHWAACSRHSKLVALLLKKGANHVSRDDNGKTPLHLAASARYKALLDGLATDDTIEAMDRMQWTPLHLGAMVGAEDFVRNLLQLKVDVNRTDRHGQTSLSWAAKNGHETLVELLIKNNANMNSDSYRRRPLSHAAENGHMSVVELLIKEGANMDSKDVNSQTPLSHAAKNGHMTVVELLIKNGVDLKFKDI